MSDCNQELKKICENAFEQDFAENDVFEIEDRLQRLATIAHRQMTRDSISESTEKNDCDSV